MVERDEILMEFNRKRKFGPKPFYPLVEAYKRPDNNMIFIGGPCSYESKSQLMSIAFDVAKCGATHLRSGVFRAGTYPSKHKFGWLDPEMIAEFHNIAKTFQLQNIIELLDYRDEWIFEYADCLQIGARQMQNYTLLKVAAESGKPIFLKRGTNATLDETLGACEWLLSFGARELCIIERGSVSFLDHCRWEASISMIPAVQALTKIPIIIDASHSTGRRDLVRPMTLAGIAAGADGCLVEVHYDPDNSLSDSEQALMPEEYRNIMEMIKKMIELK